MAYLLVILVALLSKGFFNSKLCRGEYGFFKTYFLYGGLGSFAILFGVLLVFGSSALKSDDGSGLYAVLSTARLTLFCLAIYLAGIGLAVYRIKNRVEMSPLMNIYAVLILIAFVLLIPSAIFKAPVYFLVYALSLFVFYKFRWNNVFIERFS